MKDFVKELCHNCGLCCDGVLFANVKLQSGDDARQLMKLGLSLRKKGRQQTFAQPCSCFDGKLCCIYADRPKRCRTFECGLLKRVQGGEMEVKLALEKIANARRLADRVRQLFHRLGQNDERFALTKRYARMMSAPIDLSTDGTTAKWRGELMLAVNDLMHVLQSDFLK